jgi:hypothetical protein
VRRSAVAPFGKESAEELFICFYQGLPLGCQKVAGPHNNPLTTSAPFYFSAAEITSALEAVSE